MKKNRWPYHIRARLTLYLVTGVCLFATGVNPVAAVAAAAGHRTEQGVAGAPAESTPLQVAPDVHQTGFFPSVTPDGRYLLVRGPRQQWLEAMNGRKYAVFGGTDAGIYGSTPGGDVIMRRVAGGAPLWYAVRPGAGIVQWLPGRHDPFAKSSFTADENARGQWAMGVTNDTGAGPLTSSWVDVGTHSVPILQDVWTVLWSPNGKMLGVLAVAAGTAWLETYNPQTLTRTVGQYVPVAKETVGNAAVSLAWSSTGRFLATAQGDRIAIYDTVGRRGALLTIPRSTSAWGFAGAARLFTIAPASNGNTEVAYYDLPVRPSPANQSATGQNGAISRMANSAESAPLSGRASIPGRVAATVTLPTGGVLAQTMSGSIFLVEGTAVKTVVSGADSWWYDRANGYLYYGLKSQLRSGREPVWRLRIVT